MTAVSVLAESAVRGHEQVAHFYYPEVGLKAIVGIHSTVRGPALGGCRMRLYTNELEALDDCMRLSEGMTYKNALADLPIGGGKAVIIADPKMKEGRAELFRQFGHCLNHLAGRYITAEDMGTSVSDVSFMREVSTYAAGFDPAHGGGGDPSPWTARGCFVGILAACEKRYGSQDLKGKKVAVQGAGHVGTYLVEHLRNAGAEVFVTDTSAENVRNVVEKFGAVGVALDKIYSTGADIFAPCAIGQTVNQDTLKELSCTIIAGAANNQLSDPSVYKTIEDKKILYCPDFAINAGGVISVGAELNEGGWKREWVSNKVENIQNTIRDILSRSEKEKLFTEVVAVKIAKEKIQRT